jgi:hypothetical protein
VVVNTTLPIQNNIEVKVTSASGMNGAKGCGAIRASIRANIVTVTLATAPR